jgi:hypothetical protein
VTGCAVWGYGSTGAGVSHRPFLHGKECMLFLLHYLYIKVQTVLFSNIILNLVQIWVVDGILS